MKFEDIFPYDVSVENVITTVVKCLVPSGDPRKQLMLGGGKISVPPEGSENVICAFRVHAIFGFAPPPPPAVNNDTSLMHEFLSVCCYTKSHYGMFFTMPRAGGG